MVISNAKIEDAKTLALLHKQAFGKIHFTTNFSISFLTKYFENLIEKMKYGIVIKDNGDLVGYLFASTNSGQIINNFLKINFLKVFFYLIGNPRFIVEKILELFNKFLSKTKNTGNEISLYLITVDTSLGGRGIGKELINNFEELVKGNSEKSYTLSVRKNNQQAIDFYLKNNFIQIESNKKSIKFRKEFVS
jgi:ribosomal protein S18 acetylase RimI-like enzyme